MSCAPSLYSFAFRPPEGDNQIRVRNADALDNEFRYYSKLIENLTLSLAKREDREAVPPWVHKLSSAGYNVVGLRDKRNRYMMMLCLSLSMDSVEGPFSVTPPTGILTDLRTVTPPLIIGFDWEVDKTWEREVEDVRKMERESAEGGPGPSTGPKKPMPKCPFHKKACPRDNDTDRKIGITMDRQFRFLLNLVRPYGNLLFRSHDKNRAAKWIQRLCLINHDACSLAKGVRNDYMMVLTGYLSNRCLIGPFMEFPIEKLLPIAEMTKMHSESQQQPITDPTHPRTAQFFQDMPTPIEGAFALIACTGDLYEPRY